MPWMLQPKSYTQIARPNLYNVAYRRVATYKGMGRLHPTNYLQIGARPNMIGATTGQYNTLSGQLSLLPPSLRGLGQATVGAPYPCSPNDINCQVQQLSTLQDTSSPWTTPAGMLALQPGGAALMPYLPVSAGGAGAQYQAPSGQPQTNYIPWIIGAALFVVLMGAPRR